MRFIVLLLFVVSCLSLSAQPVSFTSSNLPIIVLKTNGKTILDDPKIVVDMGVIENPNGQRNNLTDPYNVFNGKVGIEIRGSSSQMFPKKQYGIELRDATGEDDIEASIFGMPKDADWILFAPYNDKSLMRDFLAYRLGRATGRYAPRQRFFELVLNDQYMGIYLFLEKIKRGKNRLPIDKLDADEISGDALTGGYIMKIDKTTGGDEGGFISAYPPPGATKKQVIYYQYEYPKGENIVPAQKTYIQGYIKQFEDALNSENFADPVNGWTKYADMDSFIDYFIMNEVSKNADGYRLSTFLHKKKDSEGGKIHMGPIWDFNLGFGNVNYCTNGNTNGLVIDFNTICPEDGWQIPFWWKKLWTDQTFRAKLSTRWIQLRAGAFSTTAVHGYIDSVATVLNESQARNFQRWPVLGVYEWPNYASEVNIKTYPGIVDYLKTWVSARMTYLDATFNFSVTGVGEPANGLIVNAFPNPFEGEVLIDYEIPNPGVTSIEIMDITGRNISSFTNTHYEAGRYSVQAPLVVSPGLYLYKVKHNQGEPVVGKLLRR